MQNNDITAETRSHYDKLISEKGEKYFHDRWLSNPVAKSQYYQTLKSIRQLFKERIGSKQNDILEIGSGPGTWTGLCLEIAKSITLFDISEEFLKIVQNTFKNDSRISEYVCGDFVENANKLGGNRFNLIFSGRALEYMSDKKVVVDHGYEYLKPGGHLMIITKNPQWRDKVNYGTDNNIHRAQIYWKDLKNIYEEAGFIDVEIRPAALGSYYYPYNNFIGIKYCEFKYSLIGKNEMREQYDSITESYIVDGKKPG